MKQNLFRFLAALAAFCTVAAGLGDYLNYLPEKYAKIGFLMMAGLMGLKEIVVIVGDIADDGKRNGSYRLPLLLLLLLLLPLFLMTSCVAGRFLGLDAKQWSEVGLSAGQGAISKALPVYLEERRQTSAKDVQAVAPAP